MNFQKFSTLAISIFLSTSISFGQDESNGQISGVNYEGFQNFGTQSCNFVTNSSYQCFENSLGQTLQSQIVPFNSLQELCNQLRNDNLNSVAASWGQMSVASNVRLTYVNNNCQAYPNLIGPDIIKNDTNLLRNMKCKMTVEAIDGAFGNTGEMQVPVTASGVRGQIYASMFKEKSQWILKIVTSSRSTKYLTVDYVYTKGSNSSGDQLTLRSTLNNTAAEVTGFAGSEVSLVINNVDPVANAVVTCVITDSNDAGAHTPSSDYRCRSSGNDMVDNSSIAIEISKLIDNSLTFTTSESLNSVVMTAEGTFALRQGTAVFTATRNGSKSGLMNITARANLSTPVKFKVKQLSKSVDVSCK